MRSTRVRPFGQSLGLSRVWSCLLMLILLGMLYSQFRQPGMWTWLATTTPSEPAASISNAPAAPEHVVAGPNEQNPEEVESLQDELAVMEQRSPLHFREMAAYWRLLGWSRTRSSQELEQTALRDVAFTQLWEDPEKYRGKLIRLRMHVRRVLQYEPAENPLGAREVYEAWGWTDESRSLPYVVVFLDKPAELPLGTDIRGEVVFVGYFLKVMSYSAFDNQRGAPLLAGRVRLVDTASTARPRPADELGWLFSGLVGVVLVASAATWIYRTGRKPRTDSLQPTNPPDFGRLGSADPGMNVLPWMKSLDSDVGVHPSMGTESPSSVSPAAGQ